MTSYTLLFWIFVTFIYKVLLSLEWNVHLSWLFVKHLGQTENKHNFYCRLRSTKHLIHSRDWIEDYKVIVCEHSNNEKHVRRPQHIVQKMLKIFHCIWKIIRCQDIGRAFSQLSAAVGETSAGPALARMGACYEEMGGNQGLVGEQVRIAGCWLELDKHWQEPSRRLKFHNYVEGPY